MVGNELVLHMNEEFVPMNEMHVENKVSLDCVVHVCGRCGWEGEGCVGVQ